MTADELKAKLPLPNLMVALGFGDFTKASCKSPFREDAKPSWGIRQRDGAWFFHDFATGESGDEITFLGRVKNLDPQRDFLQLMGIYAGMAGMQLADSAHSASALSAPRIKPDRSGFASGTEEQLKRLGALRGIVWLGCKLAHERGLLVFGQWHDLECWGVTDSSGRVLEIRRMDGKPFPAVGSLSERKSHALKGSEKAWPVGILEARPFPVIALCEGMPDLLQAHFDALWESKSDRVGCVAMLSASPAIALDALPHFKGKIVRIFAHHDANGAGMAGAERWKRQLRGAGVADVDIFSFAGLRKADGNPVGDLNDFAEICVEDRMRLVSPWEVLP